MWRNNFSCHPVTALPAFLSFACIIQVASCKTPEFSASKEEIKKKVRFVELNEIQDKSKQENATSPENKQCIYSSVCLDCLRMEVNKLNLFSLNFPLLTTDAVNIKSARVWCWDRLADLSQWLTSVSCWELTDVEMI